MEDKRKPGRPKKEKNIIKQRFKAAGWRQVRGDKNSYTMTFADRKRAIHSEVPRINYDTVTNVLNIFYPTMNDNEIVIHLTRRKMDAAFKELLKPTKWLTVVTRDSTSRPGGVDAKARCNYTVDYYCQVAHEPNMEQIERICEICEDPIIQE